MITNTLNVGKKSETPKGELNLQITANFELFKLLAQDSFSNRKFSKAEAFFDLLTRHRLVTLTKDESYLGDGILSYAKAWGWDRGTVKKFIDSLCSVGAVTIQQVGRSQIVRLANVTEFPNDGSEF